MVIMEMGSLTDPQVILFIFLIMSCMIARVLHVQYGHHCRPPAVCRPIPSALHQALLPSRVRSRAALLLPLPGPQLDYSDSLEQRHGASRESAAVRNRSMLQWVINLIRISVWSFGSGRCKSLWLSSILHRTRRGWDGTWSFPSQQQRNWYRLMLKHQA